MHFDAVSNYSMKCRLYPTKIQRKRIDDALTAIRVFHNCLIYDMWNNGVNTSEKSFKSKDAPTPIIYHRPNLSAAMKAAYKEKLIRDHPIIEACPQAAITTEVGLKADLKREFSSISSIENHKPVYYSDLRPQMFLLLSGISVEDIAR